MQRSTSTATAPWVDEREVDVDERPVKLIKKINEQVGGTSQLGGTSSTGGNSRSSNSDSKLKASESCGDLLQTPGVALGAADL
jgi:hypothetical protein